MKDVEALTNHQIDRMMHNMPTFRGCFPKDKIPRLKKRESCIINLHNSNQDGSHWVALHRKPDGDYRYFDSYGGHPVESVIKRCKRNNLAYNSFQCQTMDTNYCGYYCMLILRALNAGMELSQLIYSMHKDTELNDKFIMKSFAR